MSKSFIGTGWKFPVSVDPSTGRIQSSSMEDDIREAIEIILGTAKGERIMRKDFGSRIKDFVFESPDATTLNLLKREVKIALSEWEPRITDLEVDVFKDPDQQTKLVIEINYRVRKTNNLFNLVYPFYINEGTRIE